MDASFTIGTLARRGGVGVQTVLYYERRGLLPPIGRRGSGYRLYDEGSLKRLRFIRRAKELGFTLKECGELLALSIDSSVECAVVRDRAEAKLMDVRYRIKSLEAVKVVLEELVGACEKRGDDEECPILKSMEDAS